LRKLRSTSVAAIILALGCAPAAAIAGGFGPHPAQPTSGAGWVDRSGFTESVYRTTIEGALVGGLVGLALIDPTDSSTAVRVGLGTLLGGVSGLAIPLLFNQGEVRTGDVVFVSVGQGWGLAHGFLVPLAFQMNQCLGGAFCDLNIGSSALRLDAALAAGLSLAGGLGASMLAPTLNFTPGQADAIGWMSILGGAAGLLLVNAFAPPNTPPEVVIAAILGSADLGLLAGWYFRDFFDMDRSRVGLMGLGAILGTGFGYGLAWFLNPRVPSLLPLSLSMLGGGLLGLAVAYYASSGLDGYKRSAPGFGGETGALASFDGRRWALGAPAPRPVIGLVRGETSIGVGVDLLGGTF
jgi:hypothetical protein